MVHYIKKQLSLLGT